MGRPHRTALGGYVYHMLNRANGRLPIFQKDGAYAAMERCLERCLSVHAHGAIFARAQVRLVQPGEVDVHSACDKAPSIEVIGLVHG